MTFRNAIAGATLFALVALVPSAWAQQQAPAGQALHISGAGATFPAPLYKQWIESFRKIDPTIAISYGVVGSGEGVKRFLADSVDFGASDAAMSDEQIGQSKHGTVLVPVTAGILSIVYNLPGLNAPLKLSRQNIVDIYLGNILKWNDARLQQTNPGLNLPDRNIATIARQDSSGTTFVFTNHLSAASKQWRDHGPGAGKVIDWPSRPMIARGNEGVAARVKITEGGISYVEYHFAKRLGLSAALVENKAGKFVAPSDTIGEATILSNLRSIPPNLRLYMPDPEGEASYPVVSFTWLLLKEHYEDSAKRDALKRFVTWSLKDGQDMAPNLGYIRLPAAMAERALTAVTTVQ